MRNLAQFTESKLLVPRLLSTRRESAVIELSKRLEVAGRIAHADSFVKAVLERESLASTAFDGIAAPLARGADVRKLSFAIGLAAQPVHWQRTRSAVHAILLFAVPISEGHRYLSLMRTFAGFLGDEAAFSELRRCSQPEEMLGVLGRVKIVQAGRTPASAAVTPETCGASV